MSFRLGLCCIFKEEPIRFRTVTYANLKKEHITQSQPYHYLGQIISHNCESLRKTIIYCANHALGSFRINSQFFPLATHPEVAYTIEDLPQSELIQSQLEICRNLSLDLGVRLTLHPDQFILLNSPSDEVLQASIKELNYQDDLASRVGADVIVIHAGGGYGNKAEALERLEQRLDLLSLSLREKITLENDDRIFTPQDLLPLCTKHAIPLTYDVHHHRCCQDELSIEVASQHAYQTWSKEPLFHLSSPIDGWDQVRTARKHHDYIDYEDFPTCWQTLGPLTIEVEAKAKELAVIKLQGQLLEHHLNVYQTKKFIDES